MRLLLVSVVLVFLGCKKDPAPEAAPPAKPAREDKAATLAAAPERKQIVGKWRIELDPDTQRTADLARLALNPKLDAGVLHEEERFFVDGLRDGGAAEAQELIDDIEESEITLTTDTLIIRAADVEDRVPYEVLEAGGGKVRVRIQPPGVPAEQIVFTLLGSNRMAMGDTSEDPAAVMLQRVSE